MRISSPSFTGHQSSCNCTVLCYSVTEDTCEKGFVPHLGFLRHCIYKLSQHLELDGFTQKLQSNYNNLAYCVSNKFRMQMMCGKSDRRYSCAMKREQLVKCAITRAFFQGGSGLFEKMISHKEYFLSLYFWTCSSPRRASETDEKQFGCSL